MLNTDSQGQFAVPCSPHTPSPVSIALHYDIGPEKKSLNTLLEDWLAAGSLKIQLESCNLPLALSWEETGSCSLGKGL